MKFKNFFDLFFGHLNKKKIQYCILRNYSSFPSSNESNDIDILVSQKNLSKIIKFLNKNFSIVNFNERKNVKTFFISGVNDTKKESIQIDLLTELTWKGLSYLKNNQIFDNIRYYKQNKLIKVPSKKHEKIITLFSSYLVGGWINLKYQHDIKDYFCKNKKLVLIELQKILNKKLATDIVESVIIDNNKKLLKLLTKIKLVIIYKNLINNPLQFFYSIYEHYKFELIIRFTNYPLNQFCILGVDGVGKSTIIKSIIYKLKGNSKNIIKVHLKHDFFKKRNMEHKNPHTKKKRSIFFSFLKMIYWIVGYYLKNNIHGYKNSTIIIWDRYIFDIFVDQLRYRLNLPDKLINIISFLTPSPDHTFVLIDDPLKIYKRKKELSLNDLKYYNEKYINLQKKLTNTSIVTLSNKNNVSDIIVFKIQKILQKKNYYKYKKFL